jgi:hypothetical protein
MLKRFTMKKRAKSLMRKISNGASKKKIQGAIRRAYRDVSNEVSRMRLPFKITSR